jgi:FeS assembly protein IscX
MDRHQRNRHRTRGSASRVDPLKINFVDLMNWVLALPGFDDDARHCGEKILEAIQQAWIDELA